MTQNDLIDRLDIQVRYADIDSYGHVNNAVFLSYFELGRINFLRKHFSEKSIEGMSIVVARVEVDYLSEVKLDDELVCETWISAVGRTSVVFESVLRKRYIDAARAKITMVHLDKHGRPELLPEHYRALINQVGSMT
ncbi:MAG: acyl-CoA thioesterase [Candidatus Thermoplasmatota archaeon]|nr:acyl-CoA thioesterase [Candidatus Thermoplasmatota archaeon]